MDVIFFFDRACPEPAEGIMVRQAHHDTFKDFWAFYEFVIYDDEIKGFFQAMSDKRRFDRYDVNVPVRVEISNPGELSEKIDFESMNLAAGGVLIKRGISLPAGSQIKVEIVLYFEDLKTPENPEGALIMTVTGYVVRTEPDGIAIRFNEDYEISQSLDFLQK